MIKEETELQNALLLAAPSHLPNVRLFRRNIIRVEVEDRVVRAGIKGQSDLYGLVRGGRHLELELKTFGGTLRREQLAWQGFCRRWGIPHLVLEQRKGESMVDTVSRWIEEIRSLIDTRTGQR